MSVKLLLPVMFGAVMFLVGCQGTSSGSGSSSTNAGSCNYNATTGYSTNSVTGAICSSSTQNCVANSVGQLVNPTTGLACSTTATGNCVMTSQGYYINMTTGQVCNTVAGTTGANPCSYWTSIYGVPYSPAYVNGQIMCVAAY